MALYFHTKWNKIVVYREHFPPFHKDFLSHSNYPLMGTKKQKTSKARQIFWIPDHHPAFEDRTKNSSRQSLEYCAPQMTRPPHSEFPSYQSSQVLPGKVRLPQCHSRFSPRHLSWKEVRSPPSLPDLSLQNPVISEARSLLPDDAAKYLGTELHPAALLCPGKSLERIRSWLRQYGELLKKDPGPGWCNRRPRKGMTAAERVFFGRLRRGWCQRP